MLELKNISKKYGQKLALNDINISFADWRNASNVVKAKYYSYVWVGGSQIPTSFKAITSTPE